VPVKAPLKTGTVFKGAVNLSGNEVIEKCLPPGGRGTAMRWKETAALEIWFTAAGEWLQICCRLQPYTFGRDSGRWYRGLLPALRATFLPEEGSLR